MKKILVSMFLLVFGLCLVGCDTLVEYASLSLITEDEEFTSAYIASVNGDAIVLPVDFDELKEKEFYKNIMSSTTKSIDIIPEEISTYSLIIKSDDNILNIECMSDLYANYNNEWYLINCSKEDLNALKEYLSSNEKDVPTNNFLRNQLGCEWLNEISADEIIEIKLITESVGVAPGAIKKILSSKDKTTILRLFEDCYWLDTSLISREKGQINGGEALTIKFILNDCSVKEIYINNGNYKDTNGDYYELLYIPMFKENEEYASSYGFVTYQGTAEIWWNSTFICEIPMTEIEFIEGNLYDTTEGEIISEWVLKTEFGNLYFSESHLFSFLDDSTINYELTGMKLFELVEKYSNWYVTPNGEPLQITEE